MYYKISLTFYNATAARNRNLCTSDSISCSKSRLKIVNDDSPTVRFFQSICHCRFSNDDGQTDCIIEAHIAIIFAVLRV